MPRHEPTLIAAARSQMTASSPRAAPSVRLNSRAKLGDNPLYHPARCRCPALWPGSIGMAWGTSSWVFCPTVPRIVTMSTGDYVPTAPTRVRSVVRALVQELESEREWSRLLRSL